MAYDIQYKVSDDGETVTIVEGVTEIPWEAFKSHKSVKRVILPKSAYKINLGAFRGCSKLEELTILGGVRELSLGVFDECESLKTLRLPSTLTHVTYLENARYKNFAGTQVFERKTEFTPTVCKALLCNCKQLKELQLPNGTVLTENDLREYLGLPVIEMNEPLGSDNAARKTKKQINENNDDRQA